MSAKRSAPEEADDTHSVLDDTISVESDTLGVAGTSTAKISLALPRLDEDIEALDDDGGADTGQQVIAAPIAPPVKASAQSAPPAPRTPRPPAKKAPARAPARLNPTAEVPLASKRLGELGGSSAETADLLTADRLIDAQRRGKPEPEGGWRRFVYRASGRLINPGDSRKVRAQKVLSARIAAPLPGGARFVAVLSRKGGVGKTTVTTLLGMALADSREDRVVAVDANPDRGTLADRFAQPTSKSVRDLAQLRGEVHGYQDLSSIVARDATRLDVIASGSDPTVAEAFSGADYRSVAEVASRFYSLVLTDTGTGIVHSAMTETLALAGQVVIVAGLSVDEARLASETLTWLAGNGHEELAKSAIVVLNRQSAGKSAVQEAEIVAHFASRVRHVVHLPYDERLAAGGPVTFADLAPETRMAARLLAALVVESLRLRPV